MKASERHKLKTNELAESLGELGNYLREHGAQIMTIAVIGLVVVVGGFWWWHSRAQAQHDRVETLQNLMMQQNQMALIAARQGRLEAESVEEQKFLGSYDAAPMIAALRILAEESAGTPIGMTALLQEAKALRSQLLLSNRPMTAEQKDQLCQQAENAYQRVLQEYPREVFAVGMARLGLGLVAEDRGDWSKARQIYESVVAEGQGQFAGTVFPQRAQKRLALLDRINKPIEFLPGRLPEEAAMGQEQPMAEWTGEEEAPQEIVPESPAAEEPAQ